MNEEHSQNIDDLINDLSSDIKPVKKLAHPLLRVFPWVIVSLAYMVGVVHFLGVRYDFQDIMRDETFIFEMVLLFCLSLTAAYAAGLASIPDMREQKWFLAVPTTIFGVFVLWIGSKLVTEMPDMSFSKFSWHHCFSDGLMLAFMPIVVMVFLVRKGCTTMPRWACFMSILAVGGLGWAALRISCGMDLIGHVFVYHFTPFLILGSLLGLFAHKIYKW